MKKQTNLLTHSQPGRKQWMLIATIVAMVYRNQSNRSVPAGTLPLNAAKETLVNLISDESFILMLNIFLLAGLFVFAIFYNRLK